MDQSRVRSAESLAEFIRTSIHEDAGIARELSSRRILIHAQVAMKALEPDETVELAALRDFDGTGISLIIGDSVLLLTDRAILVTREPVLPAAFLSRVKRYELSQVEAVSVEPDSRWPSRLRVDLRDEGSQAFSLTPTGKSEEAARLIQPWISATGSH
jgi:hypothetical protein